MKLSIGYPARAVRSQLIALAAAVVLLAAAVCWIVFFAGAGNRVQVRSVQRELGRELEGFQRELRQAKLREPADLENLVDRYWKERERSIAWIQVRNTAGAVAAHAGLAVRSPFERETASTKLLAGKPLYTVRSTSAGAVLVGLYAVNFEAGGQESGEAGVKPAVMLVEISMFLRDHSGRRILQPSALKFA